MLKSTVKSIVAGAVLVCVLAQLPAKPVNAQEAVEPEVDIEQVNSALRLAFLKKAVARFSVHQTGDGQAIAKPLAEPAIRWVNPLSNSRDGILSVFAAGGRPVGMAQLAIYHAGNAIHEFHITSDQPFELRRDDTVLWKSKSPTLSFDQLQGVRSPLESESQRLTQMRRIAAEFQVWDDHGWEKTVRQELRLLTQPVYRYSDSGRNVVDGAVFVFALANDPEAVLILEASETDGNRFWQYAFSPVTIYAVEAHRNGGVVWAAKERRVFNKGYITQYVGDYQMATDDPALLPIMPSGK
jgi:hypothetical protein